MLRNTYRPTDRPSAVWLHDPDKKASGAEHATTALEIAILPSACTFWFWFFFFFVINVNWFQIYTNCLFVCNSIDFGKVASFGHSGAMCCGALHAKSPLFKLWFIKTMCFNMPHAFATFVVFHTHKFIVVVGGFFRAGHRGQLYGRQRWQLSDCTRNMHNNRKEKNVLLYVPLTSFLLSFFSFLAHQEHRVCVLYRTQSTRNAYKHRTAYVSLTCAMR